MSDTPLDLVAPAGGLDRDLMFARVEQRLLGRSLAPVRIGRFVVLRRLGHGGMGVVYEALDPQLDRKLAIKLVDDAATGDGTPKGQQELLREARAAAALTHPNVVTIYEVATESDTVFVAMELVDGPTLRGWLSDTSRTWREIVEMFVGAGRGLAAAHAAGLVHRDFKPDNVLIGSDGRPRVADFGLARAVGHERTRSNPVAPSEHGTPPSEPGHSASKASDSLSAIAGTPRYMAPEQYEARGIGPASDQFAFCVALYEALCDTHPFGETNSPYQLAERVLSGTVDPPQPTVPSVPASVLRAITRGLARAPKQRHATMDALVDALAAALGRRNRFVLGAGALALAGLTAALGYGAAPQPSIDPCADVEAPLAEHWNEHIRQTVHRALRGGDAPSDTTTADLVIDKLDRYAQQWIDTRQQACTAARIDNTSSDLRLERSYACLDRRLVGLETVVGALADADDSQRQRASASVDQLAPLARCSHRSALLPEGPGALQTRSDRTQPGVYARWEELFADIERAYALRSLGQTDEALALADQIVSAAQTEHLRAIEAAARGIRGRILLQRSKFDEADTELRAAVSLAMQARRDDIVLSALLRLSALERDRGDALERAAIYLDMAKGIVERDGTTAMPRLRYVVERARVDRALGRYAQARDGLQAGLDATESTLGADHITVMSARNDLAANLASLGELATAEATFRELLPHKIATKGPRHRSVGTLELNLGAIAHNDKRYIEARAHYEQALAIAQHNESGRRIEKIEFRLALLDIDENKSAEAITRLDTVLAARTARKGPDHPILAEVLSALAAAHRKRGALELAVQHAQRAIALLAAAHGEDFIELRIPLVTLGRALRGQQRWGESEAALRRAHGLVFAQPIDDAVRAEVCFDLAQSIAGSPQADANSERAARALALQAATLFERGGTRSAKQLAEVRTWLAAVDTARPTP